MELQLFLAPAVCILVSAMFFAGTQSLTWPSRLLITLPGIGFAGLYLAAFGIALAGLSHPTLGPILWLLFAALAACAVVSIVRVKAGALHLLQPLNFVGAAWMLFVGTMAAIGEWL